MNHFFLTFSSEWITRFRVGKHFYNRTRLFFSLKSSYYNFFSRRSTLRSSGQFFHSTFIFLFIKTREVKINRKSSSKSECFRLTIIIKPLESTRGCVAIQMKILTKLLGRVLHSFPFDDWISRSLSLSSIVIKTSWLIKGKRAEK